MLSRLGATLALATGLLVSAAAPAAHAEDPVDFGGAYVLDTVGAISGSESAVQDALDSLYERARIQLFVVYVDSFSNPSDPVDWADTTAIANGLGGNDLLLAVAVTDRQYAISIDSSFTLSDPQLDVVEAAIEGELRNSDWAQAAIVGAQTLEAEATGVVGPNVPDAPDSPSTPAAADGPGWVLPLVGGVAVVGAGAFVISRLRRRGRDDVPPNQLSQKDLDTRAGSLLVQLDDSVKTSEQELGFAIAQFGEGATKEFAAALASAKQKVQQAFAIRQQLDDATPESPADRRTLTTEIITLCQAADAELDAQADAFDELRALEKTAPQALASVLETAAAAAQRRVQAATALQSLDARYDDSALAPVAGNLEQADKLLAFAAAAADRAQAAIAAGNASQAAIQVRTAQQSVGQAAQLFAAIDTLGTQLGTASADLEAVLADTASDIAAAEALPADASLTPAIAAASTALDAARAAAGDPAASPSRLQAANADLERVFTATRDQQQRVTQARNQLDATLSTARAQVDAAAEYISTRRGGIGATARTRVTEAERLLAQALGLAAADPVAALAAAQQAAEFGSRALSLARNDVAGFERAQSFDSGTYTSGSDGADLGGLFGDWLFGGGGGGSTSRRSSWGGSSSRSSWGGSSRRSSRSGSFGGSSRSSRSSGGGRSRGGRF